MSSFVLFVILLGLALVLFPMRAELRILRQRVDELEGRSFGPAQAGEPEGGRSADNTPAFAGAQSSAKAQRTASVVSAPAQAGAPEDGRNADNAPAFAGAQSSSEDLQPEIQEPRPSPFADISFTNLNFETLVGGKLPIWVGGIALVFAGFFLVRYTIEAGLFGPGARSITATIFAFAMIAMSELGGRLPKIGASFTADPRVGQSLAGAGVATLYGTLYMAAEIYGLIGVPTAFVLVVITTAIAFALSLRHGPPTALMGLIGGFAAPWVAGMGASNLPTLLLYLAVFIAALFGLAVWRRWLWLLVLASGGGVLWSLSMLATAEGDLSLLGGFIAVSGAGALLAAKRFEGEESSPERGGGARAASDGGGPQSSAVCDSEPPPPRFARSPSPFRGGSGWSNAARYLPMLLAFVQLAILLPRMEFAATGWLLYFALSALAIALAWRDDRLLPLVAGALLLAAGPLNGAWTLNGATTLNMAMTLMVAALFGVAGHLGARRNDDAARHWALIGLAAPVLCWFTMFFGDTGSVSDAAFGATAFLAAIPGAYLAWEWHKTGRVNAVQAWATGATALMMWMAGVVWIGESDVASYSAVVALGVAAWANITQGKAERRMAIVPLAIAMVAGAALSHRFVASLMDSLSGVHAFYASMPGIADALRNTLIPALLILVITYQPRFATGRKTRAAALVVGGAGAAAFLWLIAKQPAAISTPADFIRFGFAERAVFTQILFGIAFATLTQAKTRSWPSLATAGWVLAGVAVFRLFWFDLLLLNPVMVPQAVGPVPVANLATLHMVLTAFWLWLLAKEAPPRSVLACQGLSLGAMIVAVLVTIRQAVQGNLISGAVIETGENYLYSAGLLALAIGWLAIGMTRASKLLRVAGLLLLTVVTFKAFLIDAAVLTGILRILSFLGLGIALIGIGWAYGRLMSVDRIAKAG